MSPKQLSLQLIEAREALVPITGKPSHDDIVCIHEALTPLLLQAGYNKAHAKHNLWGTIAPADAYAEKYGKPFTTPERIGTYTPNSQDAINYTQKLKAVCKICIEYYALCNTGVCGADAFILAVVENAWVYELRGPPRFILTSFPPSFLHISKSAARESMPSMPLTSCSSFRSTTQMPQA